MIMQQRDFASQMLELLRFLKALLSSLMVQMHPHLLILQEDNQIVVMISKLVVQVIWLLDGIQLLFPTEVVHGVELEFEIQQVQDTKQLHFFADIIMVVVRHKTLFMPFQVEDIVETH